MGDNSQKNKKYWQVAFLLIVFIGIMLGNPVQAAKEVSVTDIKTFKAAWQDKTVTKISLENDISGNVTMGTYRTTDIEITGEKGPKPYGFKLSIGMHNLGIDKPTTATGSATLKLHDITVENDGLPGTEPRAGFISDRTYSTGTKDSASAQNWTFELHNVKVPKGTTDRLIRGTRAQMNLSGQFEISTRSENFYTGGMYFAPGTKYYGEITRSDYSTIWFRSSVYDTDAGTGNFEIDKGASVKLRNVGSGRTFPAIYRGFHDIIVGEDAEFTATVPGSAVQLGGKNKRFIAKKGATVTLTSMNEYPSISTNSVTAASEGILGDENNANSVNAQVIFEPGSSLFVIGKASGVKTAMINWNTGSGNTFIINQPKQFDIRNNLEKNAVDVSGTNSFEISSSNLDMWKNTTSLAKVPDFSYAEMKNLTIQANNVASSDPPIIKNDFNSTKGAIRRLVGLNTAPVLVWQAPLTDADKQLTKLARVRLGLVPDDTGLDKDGNLHFTSLYASAGQAHVLLNDGGLYPERKLTTETGGYISYTIPDYYPSGTVLTGQPFRGTVAGEIASSEKIVDITPPDPAVILNPDIRTSTKKLQGAGAEAGATVIVTVNGKQLPETTTVASDGSWSIGLTDFLTAKDEVVIYLQDHAGKAPTSLNPLAPSTNNSVGNINPLTTLNYRDATFRPVPKFIVFDDVATVPTIKKTVTVNTKDKEGNAITQAGSILTYKIVIKSNDKLASEKKLHDLEVSDTLPVGLTLDKEKVTATLNKQPIPSSALTYENRKLSLKLDELQAQDEIVLEIPTVVSREAVGLVLTNTAVVTGLTSQEKLVKAQDSVANPGGAVFGTVELVSGPKLFDFGKIQYNAMTLRKEAPENNYEPLVVNDSRGSKTSWKLAAYLSKEMENPKTGDVLHKALRYKVNGEEKILTNEKQEIFVKNGGGDAIVSKNWSAEGDGVKLEINPYDSRKLGSYQGEITWLLQVSP